MCANPRATTPEPLLLTYSQPAPLDAWETHSLPIGNGALGASVFGGINDDHVVLNEKSLWSGGPGTEGWTHGNYPDDEVAWRHQRLAELRTRLARGEELDPELVMAHDQLGQAKVGYGSMQTFGRLEFSFDPVEPAPGLPPAGDYRRTLDLTTGIAKVAGESGSFVREYFASHPDRVVAIRLTGVAPVAVTIGWDPCAAPDDLLGAATLTAERAGGVGLLTCSGSGVDNGLRYFGQVRVQVTGGTITRVGSSEGGRLRVEGASEVLLVWSGATDHASVHPHYRSGLDPRGRVESDLASALERGWAQLRERHVTDHDALFSRVSLELGGAPGQGDTSDWVEQYGTNASADRHLEVLHAQYGRYLLIASSRPGSLPANLQGVWTNVNNPPWGADYHPNINVQMNYWPAWVAGLDECAIPYLDWVHSLVAPGTESAANVVGARGWMVNNETNPYAFTGVFDWPTAAWFPEAGAWLAQAFWWHHRHTADVEVLRRQGWPVLSGACELWLDTLQPSEVAADQGKLLANPSFSPEQGWFTAGAAMSQQIVTELFVTTLEAAAVLGIEDDLVARVRATLPLLADGMDVRDGAVAEWRVEHVSGTEPHHRHTSHLYALHPGRAMATSPRADELLTAARETLERRGDRSTGWSMAWKINFWSRLGDGDRAHRLLGELLRSSTLPNLWDTHPPFQIDGNFGATAGVLGMLVRSDLGPALTPDSPERVLLELLPALPPAWPTGSVAGVRTWGGLSVDLVWDEGVPTRVILTAERPVEVEVVGSDLRELVSLSAGEVWEWGRRDG
ncbi:glycoside hydrolase family 95 protein [Aestuariimicrobium kwangyangense]|uniref:glycoside hydrolase family 95 protein n=1 Tax=Aestuariimicrobium kwangyangense TaxID=396389 RepID=UPI0003B55953|nr:glycoside hydrolase family 95 protein [Aestuariimicrobium kwangyangense]